MPEGLRLLHVPGLLHRRGHRRRRAVYRVSVKALYIIGIIGVIGVTARSLHSAIGTKYGVVVQFASAISAKHISLSFSSVITYCY